MTKTSRDQQERHDLETIQRAKYLFLRAKHHKIMNENARLNFWRILDGIQGRLPDLLTKEGLLGEDNA
jgi:hypothetical protein